MKFSSIFQHHVYHYLSFSGVRKRIEFQNLSLGTYRSVIPELREYQKTQLVLNFSDVATHFYPKLSVSIILFSSHLEISTCTRELH